MHRVSIATASLAVSALTWLHAAQAQNTPSAPSAAPPQASAAAPVIAPQADQLLKQMSAYLGSAEHFTFHADVTFDHVLPTGQKLQFSAAEDVALQRPDKLYVEWSGDLGNRQFWYDGSSVTLYDPATPFYAAEAAPPDIDGMLERVAAQLDFSPPLADFLYRDPYQSVRGNIQYGFDLGPSDVGGRHCRSLAFVSKSLYWQIWIDSGPQLTPCKVVITYASRPEQPQFSAVFTDWNFAPRIAAPIFTPTVPAGAQKIPFKTVSSPK
ncbi:MAG: DUF2092 domain-containing protein [Acetobacteraceae bacterium]|nr:DUF2092 domain-containing protein [Acetobacteraceae bacterium]